MAAVVLIRARGYVESNPPIVEPPAGLVPGHSVVEAITYTMPTMVDGRPVDLDVTRVAVPADRDRIIVGGKDVTFFRGEVTPTPAFRRTRPHGYGTTVLKVPATHAAFEQPGQGDLAWLAKEKRVRIERVNAAGNRAGVDYVGVITAVRTEGRMWVADVSGELSGRAILRYQPPPMFRRTRDIARWAHDAARACGVIVRDMPDTGIKLTQQGDMSTLNWLNHLCAMAVKKDGTQYTMAVAEDNPRVFEFREVDTTTIHGTVYFDTTSVVATLVDDIAEQPKTVYGTGVTKEGMRVKNGAYPYLKNAGDPGYPFADNRAFGEGDDLSTAGPGTIEAMNWRLIGARYSDADEDDVALYTAATTEAVEELQEDAGLPITGDMDPATWEALWDNSTVGYSLAQATILPMAQAPVVRKWNRTSSGARLSRNTRYDRTRLDVHRPVNFGTGHTIRQMHRYAWREVNNSRQAKNWVGSIDFRTGALIRGQHTPGTPVTPGDVMQFRELREGMNLWAPLFDGGTVLHVSGVEVDPSDPKTGSATVDTQFRDMLTVSQIVARNRETRQDPARAYQHLYLGSKTIPDALVPFDEVGGRVTETWDLPAQQWTVIPVPAGQEGIIGSLRVQVTDAPAEYCVTVWGKNPFEDNLNTKLPTPMAVDADGFVVFDKGLEVFKNRLLLYVYGTDELPGGYAPGHRLNDLGEPTGDPITGLLEDDAGFRYHTDLSKWPVLWLAIWPKTACKLKPQRVMWPQLQAGV